MALDPVSVLAIANGAVNVAGALMRAVQSLHDAGHISTEDYAKLLEKAKRLGAVSDERIDKAATAAAARLALSLAEDLDPETSVPRQE